MDPDRTDPFVRDMDPQIWIHNKLSWISNIGFGAIFLAFQVVILKSDS
jgi:hypothetical protein